MLRPFSRNFFSQAEKAYRTAQNARRVIILVLTTTIWAAPSAVKMAARHMATHSTLPSTPYAAGITRAATLDATLNHAVFRLRQSTTRVCQVIPHIEHINAM